MAVIGIDVGGGSIKGALLNEENQIIKQCTRVNQINRSSREMAADMADIIRELTEDGPAEAIGVGLPGTVDDESGVVVFTPNVGFRQYDLRAALKELTGYEVRLINDANAAAYAESRIGAAQGAESVVVITLGTGIGGGVVIGGKLLTGYTGAASELGHMVIVKDGEPCGCGRKGCFEAYASATALTRMAKQAMAEHPESMMNELAAAAGKVGARTAFDAYDQGDPAAASVVEQYLDYLAEGLANLINIFFPEIIALSGGVANRGESLIKALEERVYPRTHGSAYALKRTKLAICSLGYESGMIGAALYAKNEK